MRKLLILIVMAVFAIMVVFMVPAMAAASRASPKTLVNDMMLAPAAVIAIPTAPATSNPLILMTSSLVVMPRATATTFTKSDRMTWNQVVLDANYSYHGRLICLTGALVSDEETFLVSAKVPENEVRAILVSFEALTGNQTSLVLVVHNPTAVSVVGVVDVNDLMVQGSRHGQANTKYDLAGNTVQNKDGTMIQLRSNSAPMAFRDTIASTSINEQRAAYNYFDVTDMRIATAIRMEDNNITEETIGTILRL